MAFIPNGSGGPVSGVGVSSADVMDNGLRAYMLRIYNWMALGLLISAAVAYLIAETPIRDYFYATAMQVDGQIVTSPTLLGWAVVFLPLIFVFVLSAGVNRFSRETVQTLFIIYSASMGACLSSILLRYEGGSIARAFAISAATFLAMSLWGYTTKRSLASMGSFLFMGLVGLILASIAQIFIHSSGLNFGINVAGVLIFTLFTAYDTQRIRATYAYHTQYSGTADLGKYSVYDALSLYLNFVNLFVFLLQFIGVRRQ